ncbi:MAG: hypothetical protein U0703_24490 [Anaerolineae bacterium]
MRRLIALLIVLLVGTLALSRWRPGAENLTPTPPTALTLPPQDFATLIPTFARLHRQLQNIDQAPTRKYAGTSASAKRCW